ncbi:MAG TPA: hypothetical protein VGO22_04725 [Pseudorhizobium sp.]|jgi:hypothetical protein|nr:hypothetical protein [Pseudorhizobium sp.]
MRDYDKALADIEDIRNRMAASTVFRGLGPVALASTAVLALATALVQHSLLDTPIERPAIFFVSWIVVAVLSVALIGAEMIIRSRRHHAGLADAMIYQAVNQFLPAGAAGAAVALIIGKFAPSEVWLLPGLWQIFVSLGLFAAAPSLPRGSLLAAAWYFLAGCVVLMMEGSQPTLSPWSMAIPFAVGQLLLAGVIQQATGDIDAE